MREGGAPGRGPGPGFPPPRHRPPWWPQDEAWPPRDADGRPMWAGREHGPWRSGWARRLGCLLGLVFLLALVGLGVVAWSIADLLGLVARGAPRPALLPFLGIGVVVVAVLLFARGFRRFAAPLDDLVSAARGVEAGDYAVRVPEGRARSGEMAELVRAFNTMAARLELDAEQRRRLLADVSHELRTPLAVVRGNLEAMVDGVHPVDEAHLAVVIEETRVLERLVEDLRTLTLAESGALTLHRETTDVDVLVGETVAGFRAAAETAGVALVAAMPDDLPLLDVDPVRLREVLSNLIANALRHTPRGGSVTAGGSVAGDRLVLTVSDTGEGIPPELLPVVFDRFAKGAASRGSGLGLAIARDLVLAHGGTIEAASRPGGGATFTVRLPIDSPSGA